MEKSRRSFFKKGLAGAILLGTASVAKAGLPDPVKPKAAKAVNPFHLGMAGYTFVNFDLETTLKTLQRLDIHYLCIKDFHLPLDSNDDQIKAFRMQRTFGNIRKIWTRVSVCVWMLVTIFVTVVILLPT